MNNSGDAAEQVVRLSLEGMEVAARKPSKSSRLMRRKEQSRCADL